MGCDYSKSTKLEFEKETSNISQSIEIMKKQQETLYQSVKQLTIPNNPVETIEELKKSLLRYLERIEELINKIKNSKECYGSFDEPRNSLENIPKNKFQESTKANSSEPRSRSESPLNKIDEQKDMHNNILEDPTIKAMIEKNRKKFVGINKN